MFRLVLWSEPKKSGKTFLAAVLILWWAFSNPDTEIIVAANDLEQSVSRVFKTAAALVKHNPGLLKLVTVRAAALRFRNGTVVTAIASDYRGAAGARHSLVVFDELWGYHSENAQRLYEELTPPPTEENAWVLVVTYAGFTDESKLLETMYHRGLAGTRLDPKLEVYAADGLFMFWSHTLRQPWQTDAQGVRYYAAQRRSLRPAAFARFHRNEWVSAESTFVTAELWDGCVDPTHQPVLADRRLRVVVGVDAGIKHDFASVQALAPADDQVIHVTSRIWRPSPRMPLDLEETIEEYLWHLVRSSAGPTGVSTGQVNIYPYTDTIQRPSTLVELPRSSGSHMRILGVGKRIRQIRQRLGLTQAQFASRLGVIKGSVARYEAGRVPRLKVLEEIARLGGVTVTSLLQDREEDGAKTEFPSVLTELGVSELVTELVTFLEGRALIMNRLPQRYRTQYKERLRELISRMTRDLLEYQEVLESLYQKRGGGRHKRRNLTRPR